MAAKKASKGLAEKLDKELEAHVNTMLEKNKDYEYEGGFTEDNWEEEMKHIPLFSNEEPTADVIANSTEYQALQALKYECEDPHERATAYKDDGNHHFKKKEYKKAIAAYTEAIKEKHEDTFLYAVLYTNKAAANFYLGNNRSALNDAVSALKFKPDHMKAIIRCATCCFDLERYDECISWCEKGLSFDDKEQKLLDFKKKSMHQKKQQARDKRKAEMKEVRDLAKQNDLLDALEKRRIKISEGVSKRECLERLLVSNSSPHSGKIYLDENKVLHWPLYFLYPEYNQSDFIEDFSEKDCFQDHLEVVFEMLPEWDVERKYSLQNLVIYFEDTLRNKLVKVNSLILLEKILSDKRYIIQDGYLGFMIFSKESDFYRQYINAQDLEEFEA